MHQGTTTPKTSSVVVCMPRGFKEHIALAMLTCCSKLNLPMLIQPAEKILCCLLLIGASPNVHPSSLLLLHLLLLLVLLLPPLLLLLLSCSHRPAGWLCCCYCTCYSSTLHALLVLIEMQRRAPTEIKYIKLRDHLSVQAYKLCRTAAVITRQNRVAQYTLTYASI